MNILLFACSKSDYFMPGFLIPLCYLIVLLVTLVFSSIAVLRTRRWNPYVLYLAADLVGLLILCLNFYPTVRFTWAYPLDAEDEAVTVRGVIEEVVPCSPENRYYAGDSDEIRRPKVITLDGEEFFSMDTESYYVGNAVELTYLPTSRIVIGCKEAAYVGS